MPINPVRNSFSASRTVAALAGHRFKGRGLTDAPQTFVGGDLHQHIQRVILYRKSNTEGLFMGIRMVSTFTSVIFIGFLLHNNF